MCLAVPLIMVEKIDESFVILEGSSVRIKACCTLVPELDVGDNCLVHAGFVIEKITAEDAKERQELLEEFYNRIKEDE